MTDMLPTSRSFSSPNYDCGTFDFRATILVNAGLRGARLMNPPTDEERHLPRLESEDVKGVVHRSAVSEASVRAALSSLLDDPQFHASARNRRFLKFVVEES